MIDVHPPYEPVHRWSDFFIHLTTKLQWAPDDEPVGDNSAPSLFTAIQEQLGLNLNRPKSPSLSSSSTMSTYPRRTSPSARLSSVRREDLVG